MLGMQFEGLKLEERSFDDSVAFERVQDDTLSRAAKVAALVPFTFLQQCSETDQSWLAENLGNAALSHGIDGSGSVQLIPAMTN